jgi:hypothetical protein
MKRSRLKHKTKQSAYSKNNAILMAIGIGVLSCVVVIFASPYIMRHKTPCANSKSCVSDLSENIENGKLGVFQGRTVIPPTIHLNPKDTSKVLGETDASSTKHIYVDLSTQKLYAFDGQTIILETWVATGRWGKTPTGNFHIWQKLRSTRMTGGSGDDFYDLPNVPFVMYFYHDFGLHGAYWHNNFGHTMSHGCVNMRQIDAEILFNWTDGPSKGALGTAVSICDRFTQSHECIQTNAVVQ